MSNEDNVGTMGDGTGKRRVFTHDQLKKRCSRFLTKITISHSPKELSDFLFEAVDKLARDPSGERTDIALERAYEEWIESNKKKLDKQK